MMMIREGNRRVGGIRWYEENRVWVGRGGGEWEGVKGFERRGKGRGRMREDKRVVIRVWKVIRGRRMRGGGGMRERGIGK